MPRAFSLVLPVKPYIKRHLENRYGNPVVLPHESAEKKRLHDLLMKPLHEMDKRQVRYQDEVCIQLDERTFYRFGHELSSTSITFYNTFLEDLFKREMRQYILLCVRHKKNIIKVIYDFIAEYRLDESITEDAIKKDFFRHCKKQNINLEGMRWCKKYASSVQFEKGTQKSVLTGREYGLVHKVGEFV